MWAGDAATDASNMSPPPGRRPTNRSRTSGSAPSRPDPAGSGTRGGKGDPVEERREDRRGGPDRQKFRDLERIRTVEAAQGPVRVEILRYGLSADDARLVTAAAADVLGLEPDPKPGGQRQLAADLGTRLAKRAKFKREHPVVLLRVGGKGADDSYENIRHGWRIGRRWIDPLSSRSPKWAVIVAGDMVVGVYRIMRWEPTPLGDRAGRTGPEGTPGQARTADSGPSTGPTATGRSTYRHSFVGERDGPLEQRYVGRSVAAYLRAASPLSAAGTAVATRAPNQIAYVWCGPHWTKPTS